MFSRDKLLVLFVLIIIFTFCSYMFMQQMNVQRILLVLCLHRLRLVQAAVLACEHDRRRIRCRRNWRAYLPLTFGLYHGLQSLGLISTTTIRECQTTASVGSRDVRQATQYAFNEAHETKYSFS